MLSVLQCQEERLVPLELPAVQCQEQRLVLLVLLMHQKVPCSSLDHCASSHQQNSNVYTDIFTGPHATVCIVRVCTAKP